ncbi:hypothetical protein LDC_0102 [sediment metagenome]|uniref:PilZ domain-containing protein n=1 Tax=sediment metagenome TaxID=749907 RepID=D9PF24_9ZZZZ
MKDKDRDLRKYTRLRSKFPIRYSNSPEDNFSDKAVNKKKVLADKLGYILNISKSGILLLLNERLKCHELLELSFRVPIKENISFIKIKGIVKWIKIRHRDDVHGVHINDFGFSCGVEFLKANDRTKIDEFIEYWKTLYR